MSLPPENVPLVASLSALQMVMPLIQKEIDALVSQIDKSMYKKMGEPMGLSPSDAQIGWAKRQMCNELLLKLEKRLRTAQGQAASATPEMEIKE